jgi:hypothetical protein
MRYCMGLPPKERILVQQKTTEMHKRCFKIFIALTCKLHRARYINYILDDRSTCARRCILCQIAQLRGLMPWSNQMLHDESVTVQGYNLLSLIAIEFTLSLHSLVHNAVKRSTQKLFQSFIFFRNKYVYLIIFILSLFILLVISLKSVYLNFSTSSYFFFKHA